MSRLLTRLFLVLFVLYSCSNDLFYKQEWKNAKIITVDYHAKIITIKKTNEETIGIDLLSIYGKLDLKKVKEGDLVNKQTNSFKIIVMRKNKRIITIDK